MAHGLPLKRDTTPAWLQEKNLVELIPPTEVSTAGKWGGLCLGRTTEEVERKNSGEKVLLGDASLMVEKNPKKKMIEG